RSRPLRNKRTAAGSSVPTSPTTLRLPRSSVAGACTYQTPPQNASQTPPIASLSAASPPPGTGGEHGGQLTRYKRRTNDPLPTRAPPPSSAGGDTALDLRRPGA